MTGQEVVERIGPRVDGKRFKDLLIYVHIPFCTSKCHFCDWVSGIEVHDLTAKGGVRSEYVSALCKQIEFYGPRLMEMGYVPRHVYWGGGTPSRLATDEIERICHALSASFDLSSVVQWSVETSPETLTMDKLHLLRASGVDRISMGVQSFDETQLRRAGRAHSATQAMEAMGMIRDAGFPSYNIDLIAGFPEEDTEAFAQGMEQTMALAPPHVTLYMYRGPATTVMAQQANKGYRPTTALQQMREARRIGMAAFDSHGYEEYMTMYFARGKQHRYLGELHYFGMEGDYIGFGDGAHSVLGHHYLRNASPVLGKGGANLRRYIADPITIDICEVHTTPQRLDRLRPLLIEAMLTEAGIQFDRFQDRFGFPFQEIRRDRQIVRMLEYYEGCGAVFEEDDVRLRVSAATRAEAFIRHTTQANEIEQLNLTFRSEST